MKKYALATLAVLIAIGMSAFTTHKQSTKKPLTDYIWFDVNPGSRNLSLLTDSDVTFNSSLSSAPSSNPDCGDGINNCVVGFNTSQVDATGQHLKPGDQVIQFTYYTTSKE